MVNSAVKDADRGATAVHTIYERREKIDRGRRSDDTLVVLRPGLDALRRCLRGGIEPREVERFDAVLLPEENPDVRAVKLVGGTGEEVAVEQPDVDKLVRSEMDRVHE